MLTFLYLSRAHCKHGELGIENEIYEPVHYHLVQALKLLPLKTAPFLCRADLQRIHTALGKVWYEKARQRKPNRMDLYAAMQISLEHYQKALDLGSCDITTVKGIAETTAELEFAFYDLFPGRENRYNAHPLFRQVLRLHPDNIHSQTAVAKYFYKKGMEKELYSQVRHMAEGLPSCYQKLRQEAFYSPPLAQALKEGFERAVEKNIYKASAYISLSTIMNEERQFSEAAEYLKKAMEFQRVGKTPRNFMKLGALFLKAEKDQQAGKAFLSGLNISSKPLNYLRAVYNKFSTHNNYSGFVEFAAFAEAAHFGGDNLQIYVAKAQMEQKLFEPAKETLEDINARHPDPQAYYLLALLAKKQRDWDAMELSIHKATVLDPDNAGYFDLLADSLIYQKKYRSAVEYMRKAIENDPENRNYKSKLEKIQSKNN